LKLLLDAMFAPEIARQLRQRGHDVVAAKEQARLADRGDPELFAAAQAEQRALVTENVEDFIDIDRRYRHQGRAHYGLVLTSGRRFRRTRAAIGQLVVSLDALLRAEPESAATSLVHWLQ
jgi:predicted nuclease of predicted toxin-antitoxin system